MSDMKLRHFFHWCYDCDSLIELWKDGSASNAGHFDCRNMRPLGLPEFIDTVNMLFKDMKFRTRMYDNTSVQNRHDTLCFIKDLIDNHSLVSGNEDFEFDKKMQVFLEDETDKPNIKRIKARRLGIHVNDYDEWVASQEEGRRFHPRYDSEGNLLNQTRTSNNTTTANNIDEAGRLIFSDEEINRMFRTASLRPTRITMEDEIDEGDEM